MTIGNRIAEVRKEKGYTQEYIAAQLEVSRQAVSKWESGLSMPSTENLLKLSGLLEVPLDELIVVAAQEASALEAYACMKLEQEQKREKVLKFLLKWGAQLGLILGLYALIYGVCWLFNYRLGRPVYNFSWLEMYNAFPMTCAAALILRLLDRPISSIGICIGTMVGIVLGHFVAGWARSVSNVGWNNAWIFYAGAVYACGFLGLFFDAKLKSGRPWGMILKPVCAISLTVAVLWFGFCAFTHARKVHGANVGYMDGYEKGKQAAAQGAEYSSAITSNISPFAMEDPALPGYMIYWPSGYYDGYYGVSIPKTR
ncbi:MAG: helix-turn-helix transcriptional regulator [Oscillospiraceae bacterium]|nr:helix-turn-helix transcriptional regulator [Oscillospiraceae bacterium]